MKNKVINTGIILAVLAVAVLVMAGAGAAATTVTDEQGLRDAVAIEDNEVILGDDIVLGIQLNIKTTVTLDLAGYTLKALKKSGVIYISSSGDLTLKDTGGNGKITGGSAEYGGGIYNQGRFTMNGGTISGNTATSGGGVYNNYEGIFTMNSGTISGNTATSGGGVYNYYNTFTMNGGTISGNTATSGGGVYNYKRYFTMYDGEISGNTATSGGGVYNNYGTFTMENGTISGNIAETGGGVYNYFNTFTMKDGEISGNIAGYGGGVYNNGTFTMESGMISGNTANYGDDVYNNGIFTQEGGTIGSSSEINSSESLMLAAASSATNDSSSASVYNAGKYINTGGKVNGTVFNDSEINIGGTAKIEEIYLPKGKEITFLDGENELEEGAKIGIWLEDLDRKDAPFKGNIKSKFITEEFIVCNNPGVHFKVDDSGKPIIVKDDPVPSTPSHSSSVASFRGEKVGNDFVFEDAVVITRATLPGATSARITNNGSGDGWYRCILETDGFKGNGTLYFQVPLDVLEVKGWTVNDVSLFGCKTTYLSTDGQYAKYSGVISQDGTYTIGFEKDAASAGTVVTPVEETTKPVEVTLTLSGATAMKVGDIMVFTAKNSDGSTAKFAWKSSDDSVATVDENGNVKAIKAGTATITVTNNMTGKTATKTITVAANAAEPTQTTQSPFPILGILAGLGIAGVLVMRRK